MQALSPSSIIKQIKFLTSYPYALAMDGRVSL